MILIGNKKMSPSRDLLLLCAVKTTQTMKLDQQLTKSIDGFGTGILNNNEPLGVAFIHGLKTIISLVDNISTLTLVGHYICKHRWIAYILHHLYI